MPNLNLRDDPNTRKSEQPLSPFKRQPMSAGGSKTIILLLSLGSIILLVTVVYLLNHFGYINLWGAKTEKVIVQTQPVTEEYEETEQQPAELIPSPEITEKPSQPKTSVQPTKPLDSKIIDSGKGNYTIFIASFRSKDRAETLVKRWTDAGYYSTINEKNAGKDGGIWYRVSIGRYESRNEAKKVADTLLQSFESGYWIDELK